MLNVPSQTDDRSRVLDATDIVDLIAEHIAIKPKGREYVCLCPFHDDHKPSCTIVPHKQFFHCFSCGAGGNAFDFVMRFHGMEFPESLKFLADRAGIELTPFRSTGQNTQKPATESRFSKDDLVGANQFAHEFFRTILAHPEHGKAAREAIAARGISAEIAEEFELGASPDRWDGLIQTATKRSITPELLLEAGLAKARSESNGSYDTFRNRVMFPILDRIGRPIAFGARRIKEDDDPKYLNSPETSVFDKSSTLFGIKQALSHIKSERCAIVTEGYTDVISLYQAGVRNAVATLGTALTARHARALRGLCDRVVLVFDGDEAGRKAADRAIEVFFGERLDVRIAVLETGTDPDDMARTPEGTERFRSLIAGAVDALDYRLQRVSATLDARGAERGGVLRADLIEAEIQQLASLGLTKLSPLKKQLVVRRLADLAGAPERTIIETIQRALLAQRPRTEAPADDAQQVRSDATFDHAVGCLLAEPKIGASFPERSREILAASGYASRPVQVLAQAIDQEFSQGRTPTLQQLLSMIDDAEARKAGAALCLEIERITESDSTRITQHWNECARRILDRTAGQASRPAPDADASAFANHFEGIRQTHQSRGSNPLAMPKPSES